MRGGICLLVSVIGGESEDDVEFGGEFTGFGSGDGFEGDHEVSGGLAELFEEAVLGISGVAGDEALGGEGALVIPVNGDVDVRGAGAVGDGLDGAEVIAAIAGGEEAAEALEGVVALGAGEASVLAVDVGALVIDLPDFDTGVGDGVALEVGDLSVEVGDGTDGGGEGVVDAEEVVIGIEGEFVGVEGALGHGGGGGEEFGEGSGIGEEGGGSDGGLAEEGAAVG